MELETKLLREQNDRIKTVTLWDEIYGGAPGGTFATLANNIEGKPIQPPHGVPVDPFLRLLDGTKSQHLCTANLPHLPSLSNTSNGKQWTTPFSLAAGNAQVVGWSYALRHHDTTASTLLYSEAAVNSNFATAFVNYVGTIMFGSLLFNPITAYITKMYVVHKPGEGPSMIDMETKRKCQITTGSDEKIVIEIPWLEFFFFPFC
jgi:hypothetical protein